MALVDSQRLSKSLGMVDRQLTHLGSGTWINVVGVVDVVQLGVTHDEVAVRQEARDKDQIERRWVEKGGRGRERERGSVRYLYP